MKVDLSVLPKGWLAFELNVLRRLNFDSASLPFVGDSSLGVYLKRSGVRVIGNDLLQQFWVKAVARVQNNVKQLTEEQVAVVLEDAYVPRHRLYNPSLRNWFSETDAWWFDNVRENIRRLESPLTRAVALDLGMAVGDYALSFDKETLELRQPLTYVFRRLWNNAPAPVNNGKNNSCTNKEPREFVTESHTDLLFLRLPLPSDANLKNSLNWTAWREEWVRSSDSFWDDLELQQAGRLGSSVETKHQYLRFIEDMLHSAAHLPKWVIANVETDFLTTGELIETVNRIRRVESIYTKDFSELSGVKAIILTA